MEMDSYQIGHGGQNAKQNMYGTRCLPFLIAIHFHDQMTWCTAASSMVQDWVLVCLKIALLSAVVPSFEGCSRKFTYLMCLFLDHLRSGHQK